MHAKEKSLLEFKEGFICPMDNHYLTRNSNSRDGCSYEQNDTFERPKQRVCRASIAILSSVRFRQQLVYNKNIEPRIFLVYMVLFARRATKEVISLSDK